MICGDCCTNPKHSPDCSRVGSGTVKRVVDELIDRRTGFPRRDGRSPGHRPLRRAGLGTGLMGVSRQYLFLLLVVASSVVACGTTTEPSGTTSGAGSPDSLGLIVLPDAEGRMPPDVDLGCLSGPFFPASALDEIRPLEGSGLLEVEAAMRDFLDDEEGQFWPQDGWEILDETDDHVLLLHGSGPDGFAFISVRRENGDWRWAGANRLEDCPLRTSLPPGLNIVEWRIDPSADPLTPQSTTVAVLVTERECASGQAMNERLLGPEVVTTNRAVFIAFAAEPLGRAQTCQGNPEQGVIVELPEALGDRELLDGLAVAGNLEDFLE